MLVPEPPDPVTWQQNCAWLSAVAPTPRARFTRKFPTFAVKQAAAGVIVPALTATEVHEALIVVTTALTVGAAKENPITCMGEGIEGS